MSRITLIAAAGKNNELGKDNDLLWHLPDDFKRFKKLTTNHHIIMGRKTFESFPKPLPNRRHIVITRDTAYSIPHPNCEVVHSLEAALEVCKEEAHVYIIGGGEIYKLSLEHADAIELTRVHGSFDADTYFPNISDAEWQLVYREDHPADDRHAYAFSYLTYSRKKG